MAFCSPTDPTNLCTKKQMMTDDLLDDAKHKTATVFHLYKSEPLLTVRFKIETSIKSRQTKIGEDRKKSSHHCLYTIIIKAYPYNKLYDQRVILLPCEHTCSSLPLMDCLRNKEPFVLFLNTFTSAR